jgi:uncharacterized paraquat-inducible protein A
MEQLLLRISLLYIGICIFYVLVQKNQEVSKLKLFFTAILLTPLGAVVYTMLLKRNIRQNNLHQRCPRCKYYFSHEVGNCPVCEKEGVHERLMKVDVYYGLRA